MLTKKRTYLEIREPFLDGFARLATLFASGKLKAKERLFAQRRSFRDVEQVKKIEASVAAEKTSCMRGAHDHGLRPCMHAYPYLQKLRLKRKVW